MNARTARQFTFMWKWRRRKCWEREELQNDAFELVTGYRNGSKLLWVSSENCFYRQNTYSKPHDGIAYTQYNSECKARKVLRNNGMESNTIAVTHIPHLFMRQKFIRNI